jgi:hypothetical protein
MLFYTYLHRRASDNLPFYIGKGHGSRAWSAQNRNQHWKNTRAKHGVKVELLARWQTEAEAFEHEQFLIWCFKDMGFRLANQTAGGEGSSGRVVSDATKLKISNAVTPRLRSPEARAAASQKATLRMADEAERSRVSESLRKHYEAPEAIQRLKQQGLQQASHPAMREQMIAAGRKVARPVVCIETGAVYVSLVEAVKWLADIGQPKAQVRPISEVARGMRKSAYGYTWKFTERKN